MEKILVVDDEIQVVRLLQEFLMSKGYEVSTALNGEEALAKVKEMKPRIVLLDIMMPGIGGIDTLKEIRKIDPNIAVIMVTAIIDEELANRAVKLGAYDYITKPINIDYLETCVMVKMIQILGERTAPPSNSDSGRKDRRRSRRDGYRLHPRRANRIGR
jgi:DNA-binding NtrC family response regulator